MTDSQPCLFKLTDEVLFRIDKTIINDFGGEIIECGINQTNEHVVIGGHPSGFGGNVSYGVHFHCAKHPETEMSYKEEDCMSRRDRKDIYLTCFRCRNSEVPRVKIRDLTYDQLVQQALAAFNSHKFDKAKLIRIDDYYTPELKIELKGDQTTLKTKESLPDGYKIVTDIKSDKDGDKIVMLQIFKDGLSKGAQFFIKPEKGQLTSDHNNPDPAEFITEINVKLKNCELSQKFGVIKND